MGHVSHEDVIRHMMQSEIFLSMTQNPSERLPNVVKEAMMSFCVCVVAESPGINELIENGRTGFVVAPGDVESARQTIEEVLTDTSRAALLAEAARTFVVKNLDADRLAAYKIEIWQTLFGTWGCSSGRAIARGALSDRS